MNLPLSLLNSLQNAPGFNIEKFINAHTSQVITTSIRLNSKKASEIPFEAAVQIPWSSTGYYLPQRPAFTQDPLFHAGTYYVQEASSLFLEQAFNQTKPKHNLKVLDLCAAPGGKTTLIQSLLTQYDTLVSNEVIKSRISVLLENTTKWGGSNTLVTNNDAKDIGKVENYFDVIIIDAPCSGSGLFRKDPKAINEWSHNNVTHCGLRQQRILTDIWPALKEGGILIYSTCSYSVAENEDIADWIVEELEAQTIKLETKQDWAIVETESIKHKAFGYRFYPYNLKGEGFFLSCFKKAGDVYNNAENAKEITLDSKLSPFVKPWLNNEALSFYPYKEQLFAMSNNCYLSFKQLKETLHIRKAGFKIGEIIHEKELLPDHALIMSTYLNKEITFIELTLNDALQYLKCNTIQPETSKLGWQIVSYKNCPLGLIKVLPNRVNNYYPKDWRILK